MPTLNINGKRVKVGDEFMQLSPEDQQATVEQIAARMGEQPKETSQTQRPLMGEMGRGDIAMGVAENALSSAVGFADTATAGLKGIGAMLPGGKSPADAVNESLGKWNYEPKTRSGQAIGGALDAVGQKIDNFAHTAGAVSGDDEDALGATLVKTAILGAPMLLGIRGRTASKPTGKPRRAPTTEELGKQAKQAYDKAENSGVIISKDSFGPAVERIRQKMADEGIDADLHPSSMAALNRLMKDADKNLSIKGADTFRKIINDAQSSIAKPDKRMASIMKREFDDYIAKLSDRDVLAGDAQGSAAALAEARSAYSKKSKSATLEKIFDEADVAGQANYTSAGYETALRQGFRRLYKRIKDGKEPGFSKAETDAVRKVATGGPIENALRLGGKLAPTGVISGGIGAGAGYAAAGPLGAMAVPALGAVSRKAAAKSTNRNAMLAHELIRRGEALPAKKVDKRRLATAALLANDPQ